MSTTQARLAIALLVISLIFVIGGCLSQQQSFTGLLGEDPAEITKISLRCGTTGGLVTVEGEEGIAGFLNLLEGKTFAKAGDQTSRTGYWYYADLYRDEEKLLRITFLGELVSVNQTYYEVSEALPKEELDSFFKSHQ